MLQRIGFTIFHLVMWMCFYFWIVEGEANAGHVVTFVFGFLHTVVFIITVLLYSTRQSYMLNGGKPLKKRPISSFLCRVLPLAAFIWQGFIILPIIMIINYGVISYERSEAEKREKAKKAAQAE